MHTESRLYHKKYPPKAANCKSIVVGVPRIDDILLKLFPFFFPVHFRVGVFPFVFALFTLAVQVHAYPRAIHFIGSKFLTQSS